jgi:hypothetical protein
MLIKLSGSATSDVASGSSHSLQDAQRNTRRPPAIGGPLRDSTSNTLHETKTESSAIDPLSQVRFSAAPATLNRWIGRYMHGHVLAVL